MELATNGQDFGRDLDHNEDPGIMKGIYHYGIWDMMNCTSGELSGHRGYWRQRADKRLGDPPPQRWIQEPIMVRYRDVRPKRIPWECTVSILPQHM